MDYNKKLNCWVCKCGQMAPNWNPEQVKITNLEYKSNLYRRLDEAYNWDYLKKYEGTMLDDEQKEILIKNLNVQLERLENSKDMYVKCIANEGAKLKEILNDITKLKDLLKTLGQKDDDES